MKITPEVITTKTKGFLLMTIGQAVITPGQKVALGDPWPYKDEELEIIKSGMKILCGDMHIDADIVVRDGTIVMCVHPPEEEE